MTTTGLNDNCEMNQGATAESMAGIKILLSKILDKLEYMADKLDSIEDNVGCMEGNGIVHR